jgi:hypothetical protein
MIELLIHDVWYIKLLQLRDIISETFEWIWFKLQILFIICTLPSQLLNSLYILDKCLAESAQLFHIVSLHL